MRDLYTKCPNCDQHFIYSSLLKGPEDTLALYCRVCDKQYSLWNTEKQREHLQNEYGEPSQTDQLLFINQLSVGDVITYKRKVRESVLGFEIIGYQHHAVVTAINRHEGKVTVVEFAPQSPSRKGAIVRSERDFKTDIKGENAWIRHYMPLDCLPVDEVLKKAIGFIDYPKSQPEYDLTRCNCQHLSSWCKVGKMKSEEGSRARMFYHYVYHGIQVISLFASPPVAPFLIAGAVMWTAADVHVRVNRIWRSEFDLMEKEMKTPWEAVSGDVLSLVASTVFLAATAATGPVFRGVAAAVAATGIAKHLKLSNRPRKTKTIKKSRHAVKRIGLLHKMKLLRSSLA